MNSIGKPVTASVYLAETRENFLNANEEMATGRARIRSSITGYPNPLVDTMIQDGAKARKVTAVAETDLRGSGIIADEFA